MFNKWNEVEGTIFWYFYTLYRIWISLLCEHRDIAFRDIFDVFRPNIFEQRDIHIIAQKLGAELGIAENKFTAAVVGFAVGKLVSLWHGFLLFQLEAPFDVDRYRNVFLHSQW